MGGLEKMSGDNAIGGGGSKDSISIESLPVPLAGTGLGAVLDEATLAKVRRVVVDGTPANTRRAYAADLRFFAAWRDVSGFEDVWPVPPEVMIRFVVEQVEGTSPTVEDAMVALGVKRAPGIQAWSTIGRRVAAIATAHRTKGLASPTAHPTVMEIVARAKRACVARGWSPKRKAAADREVLERLLDTCGSGLTDIRDRAILLFGFSTGGRRRSEISQATFERLQRVGQNYIYRMGRTKTTQEGGDTPVPLTGRAAKAMARWLALSGVQEGPLFRAVWDETEFVAPEAVSDRTIARMIKRRAELAGLDPEVFGGHSLRAGFLTEAGIRRISLPEAMSLSGHRDVNTAAIYYRAGEVLSVEAGRMMEGGGHAADPGDGLDEILDAAAQLAASEAASMPAGPAPSAADGTEARVGQEREEEEYFGELGEVVAVYPEADEVDDAPWNPTDGPGEDPDPGAVASAEDQSLEEASAEEVASEFPAAGMEAEAPAPTPAPTDGQTAHPELAAFRPSFLSD